MRRQNSYFIACLKARNHFYDKKGNARIQLHITEENQPILQFLDEEGQVINEVP